MQYKVLSLIQPWATLAVRGHKSFETRTWHTKFTGTLLIHASKAMEVVHRNIYRDFLEAFPRSLSEMPQDWKDLPLGAIIGAVEVVKSYPAEQISKRLKEQTNLLIEHIDHSGQQELLFGDFTPGRYAWQLNDPVEFRNPIPIGGNRGLWNYESEKNLVIEHLRGN